MEILDILAAISAYFGLNFETLFVMAASLILVTNFLKATPPFSGWVGGNVIYFVTGGLSLLIAILTIGFSSFLPMIVAAVVMFVLAIGGWATMKTIAHKIGKEPTTPSGGA